MCVRVCESVRVCVCVCVCSQEFVGEKKERHYNYYQKESRESTENPHNLYFITFYRFNFFFFSWLNMTETHNTPVRKSLNRIICGAFRKVCYAVTICLVLILLER